MLVSSLPEPDRRAIDRRAIDRPVTVDDRGGWPYPVFGRRISTHHLVRQEAEEMLPHLLAGHSMLELSWETVWQRITRDFYHESWVVDLPRRSRSLGPGRLVFRTTPFSPGHAPGDVPACVVDAMMEAGQELPCRHFYYLEPMWRKRLLGRRLLRPEEVRKEELHGQRKLRDWGNGVIRSVLATPWLHWILDDPVVVAIEPASYDDPVSASEAELLLIAHWD